MEKKYNISIEEIAFLLVFSLFITLFLCNLGFYFHISVQPFYYPFSFVFSLLVLKFINRTFSPLSILISLLIILVFFSINYFIIDQSADGQSYHQESMIQLKNGWNPIYEKVSNRSKLGLFLNYYPKGAETIQACIYSFTEKKEIGKSINFILLISSFILCYQYVSYFLEKKLSVFYGFIAAFNPYSITQLFTYYIDGIGYSFFLVFLCSLGIYIKSNKKIYLLIALSSFVIGSSIKFTSFIPYFTVLAFVFTYFLVTKKAKILYSHFYAFLTGISIILFVNINPYLVNFIERRNLFYPILGANSINVLGAFIPDDLVNKNRFEKLFYAIFSRTGSTVSEIKLPFSVNYSEIRTLSSPDLGLGGFGVFFSGIIILILLGLLTKKLKFQKSSLLFLLVPLIISSLIFPETWWLRFIPQFFLVAVILSFFLDLNAINSSRKILIRVLRLSFVINIGLFIFMIFASSTYHSYQSWKAINQFKNASAPIKIYVGHHKSILNLLQERNVRYIEIVEEPKDNFVFFQVRAKVIH